MQSKKVELFREQLESWAHDEKLSHVQGFLARARNIRQAESADLAIQRFVRVAHSHFKQRIETAVDQAEWEERRRQGRALMDRIRTVAGEQQVYIPPELFREPLCFYEAFEAGMHHGRLLQHHQVGVAGVMVH